MTATNQVVSVRAFAALRGVKLDLYPAGAGWVTKSQR